MTERTKRLLALMVAKPKLRRFSGLPPLTYKAKKAGFLTNYRIYGQTVDGKSVGDRTENLFDSDIEYGSFKSDTGIPTSSQAENRVRTINFITDLNGNYTISIKSNTDNIKVVVYVYSNNETFIPEESYTSWLDTPFTFQISAARLVKFGFRNDENSSLDLQNLNQRIMLNSGPTALPYEPYGYKVPVTVSNGTDTLTTTIYLPEQIRKVGSEVEYIDYAEQKQHRVRKNLLQNTATSQTINGVTFTVNSDGSVTCNNTATANSILRIAIYLDAGVDYILSGCPIASNEARIDLRKNSVVVVDKDGNYVVNAAFPCTFQLTESGYYDVCTHITSGYTCDNLTFYPMVRKATIEDDTYEPYIENTDLDVTLPALPTLTGTNVLSVGTEVQPSEVDIVGKIIPPASNTLPFPFQSDGKIIKLYSFINDSNNFIGTKTVNLVPDLDGWIMGKALSSYGEVQDNKPTLMISDFIEVEPSTSYKFGAVGKVANDAGSWHRVVYFDENKANISFVDNNNMGTSFTTPATAKYLRLCTTFWYQPFLVKSSDSYTYVPYGYNIPIVLNNTTYQAYLPEPLGKTLTSEEINNTAAVTFTDGSIYYGDGSGTPTNFTVIGPTDNHYKGYGLVDKAIDKYVLNSYGSTTRVLSPGTYTMCLTVHNPPSTNTWEVDFWANTGSTGTGWRGCRCNSSHVTNNVGTNYATFTVDDTNETQISYAMIRFQNLSEDSEWFQNTVVDIRIIEGTEPVFATRTLVKSNNEIIPLAELPKLTTVSGSNTIDVSTSPKPTVLIKI